MTLIPINTKYSHHDAPSTTINGNPRHYCQAIGHPVSRAHLASRSSRSRVAHGISGRSIAAILFALVATLPPVLTSSHRTSLPWGSPSCRRGPTRPPLLHQANVSQAIPPRPAPPWPPPWPASEEALIPQETPTTPTWYCPVMMSTPPVSWRMRPSCGGLSLVHTALPCPHQHTTTSLKRYNWSTPHSQRRTVLYFYFSGKLPRRVHYYVHGSGVCCWKGSISWIYFPSHRSQVSSELFDTTLCLQWATMPVTRRSATAKGSSSLMAATKTSRAKAKGRAAVDAPPITTTSLADASVRNDHTVNPPT